MVSLKGKVSLDRVGKFLREAELLDSFASAPASASPPAAAGTADSDSDSDSNLNPDHYFNHTLSLAAEADDERKSFVGFNNAMFSWGRGDDDDGPDGDGNVIGRPFRLDDDDGAESEPESESESIVVSETEDEEDIKRRRSRRKRRFMLRVPGRVGFKEGKVNLIVGPT